VTAADALGVVMIPALLVATWITGWRGGVIAMLVGISSWSAFIEPPPWAQPMRTVLWLIVEAAAVVIMDLARLARWEARAEKRVQREQAARATRVVQDRRSEFLAHASEVLASSPDYETTLAAVANLAVPQIADLCVVDIVGDDGIFRPCAVAHVDPRKVPLVKELRQMYPLDANASFGPPRVLRSGQSVIQTDLSDPAAHPNIHPSETRVALALGIHSTMAVPLLVGGRRLGVISFATLDSGRRYVATDLRFAEDLARRAAVAIDTARP
jgi:GAF domain-containing protein